MSFADAQVIFSKGYRPAVITILSLVLGAWGIVAAVGKFTDMVDQRTEKVVERVTAQPLAEIKSNERRLDEHDHTLKDIIESQRLMDHNITRLMVLDEQRQAERPRGQRR